MTFFGNNTDFYTKEALIDTTSLPMCRSKIPHKIYIRKIL